MLYLKCDVNAKNDTSAAAAVVVSAVVATVSVTNNKSFTAAVVSAVATTTIALHSLLLQKIACKPSSKQDSGGARVNPALSCLPKKGQYNPLLRSVPLQKKTPYIY